MIPSFVLIYVYALMHDIILETKYKHISNYQYIYVYIYIIKGSLDEKLPSYEVLKCLKNRCLERIDA